jgi:hypothetical protein
MHGPIHYAKINVLGYRNHNYDFVPKIRNRNITEIRFPIMHSYTTRYTKFSYFSNNSHSSNPKH